MRKPLNKNSFEIFLKFFHSITTSIIGNESKETSATFFNNSPFDINNIEQHHQVVDNRKNSNSNPNSNYTSPDLNTLMGINNTDSIVSNNSMNNFLGEFWNMNNMKINN